MNKLLEVLKNLSAPGAKKPTQEPAQTYQPNFEPAGSPASDMVDNQQNFQHTSNTADNTLGNQPDAQSSTNPVQPLQIEKKLDKKITSRAEEIEKKHKRFKRIVTLFKLSGVIIIGLVIFVTVTRKIYIENKNRFKTQPPNGSTDTPLVINNGEEKPPEKENKIYKNDTYRFSVEYPEENILKVEEYNDPNREFFIQLRSSDNDPTETTSGFSLIKGYMVNINPLLINLRSLEDVVNIKRRWFVDNCPETSVINKITNITFDGLAGLEFRVENCHSDFIYQYIRANQYIYEVAQIYKGDIGYKQLYKSTAQNIVSSIKIDRDGEPEPDPFAYYESKPYKFSFSYPQELDVTCCKAPPPPGSRLTLLFTMAVDSNENVLGMYIDPAAAKKTLDQYVDLQKTLLIDDYTVIKGTAPVGSQREMVINNQRAIVLENYSWEGNTLIYVTLQGARNILIISDKGFPQDILQKIFDTMIINVK